MEFVTSDIHFSHKNIMKYCPETRARFNGDVDFMNEEIIREWNETVAAEDHVYILGDIAFCPSDKAVKFLKRMNGTKTLVVGNHDTKLIKDPVFRSCFTEITPYKTVIFNGVRVCMFHYPICEWDQMHRGSVHLHGHLHGGVSGLEGSRALDAGMDATGRVAVPLEEMVAKALQGEIRGHHQKGE
jgi:calcineurin-like phosphoesterase family protein